MLLFLKQDIIFFGPYPEQLSTNFGYFSADNAMSCSVAPMLRHYHTGSRRAGLFSQAISELLTFEFINFKYIVIFQVSLCNEHFVGTTWSPMYSLPTKEAQCIHIDFEYLPLFRETRETLVIALKSQSNIFSEINVITCNNYLAWINKY